MRRRLSFAFANILPSTTAKSDKGQRRSVASVLLPSSIFRPRSNSTRRRSSITIQENFESIIFVWLDVILQPTTNIIDSLRSINDSVRIYANSALCLEFIRSSREKIFLILSSSDMELITTAHSLPAVEAIFVLDSHAVHIDGNFPKLFGVFSQQDELLRELKETLDVFEQVQLEVFTFEEDNMFLWRQLWKSELANRKAISTKSDFIATARFYYRDNPRATSFIDDFEKSYRSADVFNWIFRSPFPSRFLKHAVCFINKQQLNLSFFLFADATRLFQKQSEQKTCIQVYRGMKLSNEQIGQFEEHVDKLVCTSDFFPCTKSRTNAVGLASLSTYRSDLFPVLFKVDCESTDLFFEISNTLSSSSSVIFDICMAFHVIGINRGELTVIKLKTAGNDGKQMAQNYLAKYNNETIDVILDQILTPGGPRFSISTRRSSTNAKPSAARRNSSMITADELEAKKYVEQGEIDRALIAYRRIQPVSARILNAIGQLSADRKGDYDFAFECHTQALRMQEQDGEDISETLTYIGIIHCYRRDLGLALASHEHALSLRQAASPPDPALIAISFVGISNTYWLRQQYAEAIDIGERALALRKTVVPPNEIDIAKTLGMLGHIYHECGKHAEALDRCLPALAIYERTMPADLHALAELLNNMGSIQRDLGPIDEAIRYLERSVEIYAKILPRGHPERVSAEMDLEHANQSKTKDQQDSNTYL